MTAIVVTLGTKTQTYPNDLEVPQDMSAGRLVELLLSELSWGPVKSMKQAKLLVTSPGQEFSEGTFLNPETSLASAGVDDGHHLTLWSVAWSSGSGPSTKPEDKSNPPRPNPPPLPSMTPPDPGGVVVVIDGPPPNPGSGPLGPF